MKKLLVLFFFFFLGLFQVEAEGTICNITGDVVNIRQNIYSTGGYIFTIQDGPPSFHYYRTYNVKTCDVISYVGYNSAGFGTNINYIYQTQFIDVYINFVNNNYTDITLINKDTGQYITHTYYSNGAIVPTYRVMDGSLWIGSNYNNTSGYLVSLTGATYQTSIANPGSTKSPNAYHYDCSYLGNTTSGNTSICLYKRADNTGVYYTGNDNVDYQFVNDNGILNWNSHNMIDKILVGDYGSTNFGVFSYNKLDGLWDNTYSLTGRVITSTFASGGIIYNASVDVPYSQGGGFPEYGFNSGGRPLIWTDYQTLISYYTRNGVLYNNNQGALITILPDYQNPGGGGGGGGGGPSVGTGSLNVSTDWDTDNDGSVSWGELLSGIGRSIIDFFLYIKDFFSKVYEFIQSLGSIGTDIGTNDLISYIIPKTNASNGIIDGFNNMPTTSSSGFLNKIGDFMKWGILFLFFMGLLILFANRKK